MELRPVRRIRLPAGFSLSQAGITSASEKLAGWIVFALLVGLSALVIRALHTLLG